MDRSVGTEDIVVEIFYPGGVKDERFIIGSNAELVTESAFIATAAATRDRDGMIDEL